MLRRRTARRRWAWPSWRGRRERPCLAVGGGVTPEGIEALATVGAVAVPVTETPQSIEDAMAAGPAPLERCGERLARLLFVLD